jgi:uncharacterized protein YcbX
MRLGRVTEIWRYPVKSMGGEQLQQATVGTLGVPGDRGWALRDESAGEVRGAKKYPALLRCRARYLSEPAGDRTPPAEITLPDGARVRSDEPGAAQALSRLLDVDVTLWPRRPPEDRDHYRRALPADPSQLEQELRETFGRLPDEPLPDLSVFPPELFEYTSPLGTYFDAFPLHLLTTSTLGELARHNATARFDRRRFRPNFLIELDDGGPGFVENGWVGKEVKVGSARVKVEMPVVRCSMTMQPQEDLPRDPSVLRTIVREGGQNVGVYATVVTEGTVRVGDGLEV